MTKEKQKNRERKSDDNVVYIGKKGVMSYVLAVLTQFNNGEKEIIIKARGKSISQAVDCAEIVKHRFAKVKEPMGVVLGTEELVGNEGKPMNVSTIEISLVKL